MNEFHVNSVLAGRTMDTRNEPFEGVLGFQKTVSEIGNRLARILVHGVVRGKKFSDTLFFGYTTVGCKSS